MYKTKMVFTSAYLFLSLFAITSVSADLVMSAPPREKPEVGEQVYGPVAAYISQVIGKKVVYQHPEEWGIYQGNMQLGKYDIVFDGPHFVAWRMHRKGHELLANTPGELSFVVVVRSINKRYTELKHLRGRPVCALAPPNLATLTLLREVGIGHEPRLVLSSSFGEAFKGLLAGKCEGVVMRDATYAKLSKTAPNKTRVVFTSKPLPNQAITAGNKLDAASKNLLRTKLTTPEASAAMAKFVETYTGGKGLKAAESKDYEGLDALLKDIWGFGV